MDSPLKYITAKRVTARALLLGFIFWTVLGLIFVLPRLPGNAHWLGSILAAFAEWWSWGLLTPVIVGFDRRLLIAITGTPRRIVAHLLFGVLFTCAYAYVLGLLSALMRLAPWSDLLKPSTFTGAFQGLFWSLLVYFLIVGIAELYQFQQSYLSAALQMERLERSFTEARLNALRMQLDPHFLFNALNTISSQITQDAKLARRMIEHLGDLLRASLQSEGKQEIPISDELAFLDHYLAIQKIRFGEKLQIHIRIEPDAQSAIVPSLVLQPLVENAIRHGIGKRSRGGAITVSVRTQNSRLELKVVDDGIGLPGDWSPAHEGVGLSVTRERIAALHPGNSKLDISGRLEGGTEVRIDLPFRSNGGRDDGTS